MDNEIDQLIANFTININSSKTTIISYVKIYLQKTKPEEAEILSEKFIKTYEHALSVHEREDETDLARLYRLILEFKPALTEILHAGKDLDSLCDIVSQHLNIVLDRIRRQINELTPQKSSLGEGTAKKIPPTHLSYYCTVCHQSFEIPVDIQKKILNSDVKIPLPSHHDKEMVIKIGDLATESQAMLENKQQRSKVEIFPAEVLMQHTKSTDNSTEYLKLLSVGIVVGSSTTHLIFSNLTLKREQSLFNMSNRFNLIEREILYKSNIIFTPLLDPTTIDMDAVVKFCQEEYKHAKITPDQVATGVVIVTGETAKKKNAVEIVQRLASETGKFVSATAGHNYESMLACIGSGIVNQSLIMQNTILNVDIGGGTSKMALTSKGKIHSTAAINVGGRLLGFDKDFKIWRIDGPSRVIMNDLGMNYQIGDTISEHDIILITKILANALIEVMQGPATSSIAKKLMLTDDLDFAIPINAISFSGGVAELIYQLKAERTKGESHNQQTFLNQYNDIGIYLAEQILQLTEKLNIPIFEPDFKIRATVIGAGAFSLSISGSTCFHDPNILLPLTNIPVVSINLKFNNLLLGGHEQMKEFRDKIGLTLKNFNLIEGIDPFALYFTDINIRANISLFTKALEHALPKSFSEQKLVIIILGFDGAKVLGLTIKKETTLHENLFCLDELQLEDGDWIDIGRPIGGNKAFPITVKSLVFNNTQNDIQINREKGQKGIAITNPQKVIDHSEPTSPKSKEPLTKPDQIRTAFMQFRADHPGYNEFYLLTPEGDVDFASDKSFLTTADAQNLLQAWKNHESAFSIGDQRYPIFSWEKHQFAAKNPKEKILIVGTTTRSQRYAILKIDAGSIWETNIARYIAEILHQWAWTSF